MLTCAAGVPIVELTEFCHNHDGVVSQHCAEKWGTLENQSFVHSRRHEVSCRRSVFHPRHRTRHGGSVSNCRASIHLLCRAAGRACKGLQRLRVPGRLGAPTTERQVRTAIGGSVRLCPLLFSCLWPFGENAKVYGCVEDGKAIHTDVPHQDGGRKSFP